MWARTFTIAAAIVLILVTGGDAQGGPVAPGGPAQQGPAAGGQPVAAVPAAAQPAAALPVTPATEPQQPAGAGGAPSAAQAAGAGGAPRDGPPPGEFQLAPAGNFTTRRDDDTRPVPKNITVAGAGGERPQTMLSSSPRPLGASCVPASTDYLGPGSGCSNTVGAACRRGA
jgi:hypothetical protein